MRFLFVLPFVALTFICWGNYGVLMHYGTDGMGGGRLRPFVCVGLAYFLIAVVVPLLWLKTRGEKGGWTVSGAFWSLMSGAVGAVGALGIIMAFTFGGKPIYVMPLVFGCAPVVNTFVTMTMNRNLKEAGALFIAGVLLVACGAAGVMYFKPAPAKHGPAAKGDAADAEQHAGKDGTDGDAGGDADKAKDKADAKPKAGDQKAAKAVGNVVLATLSIALTALCWGSYGPVLHKGQMKMKGSRLRPLLCVGLAYFLIAVIVPMAMLTAGKTLPALASNAFFNEPGAWFPGGNPAGFLWSMGAGAAGAIGALGIIMAFNFGGKPIFVMPLVFGCAPIVNTFTTMLSQGTLDQIELPFVGSLALVIAGAVMVLVFAPKPGKGPPPKPADKPAAEKPADRSDAPAGVKPRGTAADEDPQPDKAEA